VNRVSFEDNHERRAARTRERRRQLRRRRVTALASLVAVVAAAAVALAASGGGSAASKPKGAPHVAGAASAARPARASTVTVAATGKPGTAPATRRPGTAPAPGKPGAAAVPVLMYHVIAPPPSGAPFPGLYVAPAEFAAQMQALKAAGWHAVTLDQLRAYWIRGVALGPGRPVVITFDNGYRSHYTEALPVLQRFGWVADENIQLGGLPPSQGGLTDAQVRGLIAAGWELDTQGISHADLVQLDAGQLRYQVASARQILRRRYRVPVNWFCYPSGHYDSTVIASVQAAGYVGSTTVSPGWAAPGADLFRLPRLRVLGGTSADALLAQIGSAQGDAQPPPSYGATGSA
jgi:peptidoglycan/xylan/chitin deacetylase (PgdA/CDA1 family)